MDKYDYNMIVSLAQELRDAGARCSLRRMDDGSVELWFERDSTLKALGIEAPTDPFRAVIDQTLAKLETQTRTAEDGTQELFFHFGDLMNGIFIFSPRPVAKRWADWVVGARAREQELIQTREHLNRISPGLGDVI